MCQQKTFPVPDGFPSPGVAPENEWSWQFRRPTRDRHRMQPAPGREDPRFLAAGIVPSNRRGSVRRNSVYSRRCRPARGNVATTAPGSPPHARLRAAGWAWTRAVYYSTGEALSTKSRNGMIRNLPKHSRSRWTWPAEGNCGKLSTRLTTPSHACWTTDARRAFADELLELPRTNGGVTSISGTRFARR